MTTKCIFNIEISITFPDLETTNSDHRKSGQKKKQQFPCNILLAICFNLNNNKNTNTNHWGKKNRTVKNILIHIVVYLFW